MSLLEPEAADYNRAYIYCYNPERKDEPDRGRRGFVPIADNATPQCTTEEFPAYMMRNVCNSRTNPANWDRDNNYYEYYTDTVIDQNTYVMRDIVVSYYIDSNRVRRVNNISNTPMLETILRIIISCPECEKVTDKHVRIVQ